MTYGLDPQDYGPNEDTGPHVRTLREGKPIARRDHACTDCPGGYIPKGQRYSLHVGLVDGEFGVVRACLGDGSACGWKERARVERTPPPPGMLGADDLPF